MPYYISSKRADKDMHTYRMFIDDERFPEFIGEAADNFVIVRTSVNAIDYIRRHGMPSFISFDHDLGGDDTAMNLVRFIIDATLDGIIEIPSGFSFQVHSQNPVGAKNIEGAMAGFISYLERQREVEL